MDGFSVAHAMATNNIIKHTPTETDGKTEEVRTVAICLEYNAQGYPTQIKYDNGFINFEYHYK